MNKKDRIPEVTEPDPETERREKTVRLFTELFISLMKENNITVENDDWDGLKRNLRKWYIEERYDYYTGYRDYILEVLSDWKEGRYHPSASLFEHKKDYVMPIELELEKPEERGTPLEVAIEKLYLALMRY